MRMPLVVLLGVVVSLLAVPAWAANRAPSGDYDVAGHMSLWGGKLTTRHVDYGGTLTFAGNGTLSKDGAPIRTWVQNGMRYNVQMTANQVLALVGEALTDAGLGGATIDSVEHFKWIGSVLGTHISGHMHCVVHVTDAGLGVTNHRLEIWFHYTNHNVGGEGGP
jgi:hypothetical protein